MTDEIKHESAAGHGDFERQDLRPSGILYFLLGLGLATLLCILGIRGLYAFLDQREKALQPAVNPLVTNVPADTRKVPGYPDKKSEDKYMEKAFPAPRLENDESENVNKDRLSEEKTLYSYGWVDEKAGTVHIPIERAMDLLVQRGLPVRGQGATSAAPAVTPAKKKGIRSEM
jgi:hypothetical protein